MKDMDKMNKEIKMGDRIFARLSMGGMVILEFMINSIGSMAALLEEVRRMSGTLRGLGRLQVRNQSRGWAYATNLMFYNDTSSRSNNPFGTFENSNLRASATTHTYREGGNAYGGGGALKPDSQSHMAFPWETH